jgi:hypothetical protein
VLLPSICQNLKLDGNYARQIPSRTSVVVSDGIPAGVITIHLPESKT